MWTLKGHAAQRAIAAWHLTWPPAVEASGNDWQAPFLVQLQLLEAPYGVVRYIAGSGMRNPPGFEEILYDFLSPLPER